MPTQRLTIFLLRDIADLGDALADDMAKKLEVSDLTQASELTGRFYSKKSFSRKPGWATYLDPVVDGGVQGLQYRRKIYLHSLFLVGKRINHNSGESV